MADDLAHGTRDKRGNWRPAAPIGLSPVATGQLGAVPGAIASYFFGWNLVWFAITAIYWFVLLPAPEVMAVWSWGWVLRLLVINTVGIALFLGAFELRLYVKRAQENRFKYNGKFPSEQPAKVFWFDRQARDNALRSVLVTTPIGTAILAWCLWLMASGRVPGVTLMENPVWFVSVLLISPILHEGYFFFIHRLIHLPPLYRWVHSVHHNSINPSPWSSLSMHPVEGALYFGTLLVHLVIWSNPFLVLWQFNLAAYGAIVGHIGFDRIEVGEGRTVSTHAQAHYLHHKYFEVNYCDDGVLPWDRWFGTWHDGTPEADVVMKERFRRIKARRNAKGTGGMPAE